MLFQELHAPLFMAPTIWWDNLGAIALASNPIYHAQTKHIEVDYRFIRENVINHDMLCLPRDKLMVLSSPIRLREAVSEKIQDSKHIGPTPISNKKNVG
jgi:hypothetical protein